MNEHQLLISLASIIVFGIGAQWLASRFQLPSILLLLLAGFVAGPITGLVQPDALLGEILFPLVAISVGLILFEGGLSLKFGELNGSRHLLKRLISLGMVVTWIIGAAGAHFIIGLDLNLSLLVGATFVVSGPTVVTPLLHYVQPRGRTNSILKWEGILIDPIGAALAVLVFEVILMEQHHLAVGALMIGLAQTVSVGTVLGTLGAVFLIQFLKRGWVAEHLENAFVIMLVVGVFVIANSLQAESGLFATTLMGMILSNQRSVSVKNVIRFEGELGLLLLSGLFILLAARVELDTLLNLGLSGVAFTGLLILIGRPLAVFLSTLGLGLPWQERAFLSWLAPRGIVAVSTASLFALRLTEIGYPGAEKIIPLTFTVVVGTVTVYSLTAFPVAKYLGLTEPATEAEPEAAPDVIIIPNLPQAAPRSRPALPLPDFSSLLSDVTEATRPADLTTQAMPD